MVTKDLIEGSLAIAAKSVYSKRLMLLYQQPFLTNSESINYYDLCSIAN